MGKRKFLFIGFGTVIEHLENVLFGLYAPLLAVYFFNPVNRDQSWLIGLMSFSLYFLVRPLGAVIFGRIGDNYGRKSALVASIGLMTLGTLGIGLTPSYESMGVAASFLFLSLRLVQGLSVGGEYSTAMTYVFESTSKNRQTFYGSLLIASTHVGGMIAASLAYTHPTNFKTVFVILGLMGLTLFGMRLSLTGSPNEEAVFQEPVKPQKSVAYLRIFLLSMALIFLFYTVTIYFNKIYSVQFALSNQQTYLINFYLLATWALLTPLVGYLIDLRKLDPNRVMRLSCYFSMTVGLPLLFVAARYPHFYLFLLAQIALTIAHILFCAPTPVIICRFFKFDKRNTHVGLSYGIGTSIAALLLPLNDYFYNIYRIDGVIALLFIFILLGFFSTFPLSSSHE
ncbi:MAG: MFS transporter [Legionella sp.]|nr:MFS transporter [Legionella sp.]